MIAGQQALGLQRCADCTRIIVDLAPGDERRAPIGIEVAAEDGLADKTDPCA